MLKGKCKILFLLVTIITLISTLSFATEETYVGEDSENGIMLISEDEYVDQDVGEIEDDAEWVNSDLYLIQEKVELDEVVDGNVFILANEVTISGEIAGDVFVCANTITIDGAYIYSGLFAIANEVVIDGIVCDVYAIVENFTVNENGCIYRDLRLTTDTFNLSGKIRRDAYISATNYNISEENGPLIGGNFNYSGKTKLDIPEDIVLGEIKYTEEFVAEESVMDKVYDYIFNGINVLIYVLVVVLLAIWLAPKFVERVSKMDTRKAFISLGIGIIAPMVAIIVLFMLLVSTVASMLSVAGILIFIAICMSGTAFASIYFGSIFAKLVKWEGKGKFVISCLIVALIIWAISQIPYIGGIFSFLIALFGIGTLIFNIVYRKEEPKTEIVEEVKE